MKNGQVVPENLSIPEIAKMMESSDMQTFALACEALRLVSTEQAYELLKRHFIISDRYKFRCILEVIFDYPNASELIYKLEYALESKEIFLVKTALEIIIQGKVRVADEHILRCIERNQGRLNNGYWYRALYGIERNEDNVERVLNLYHSCKEDRGRIAIAECLYTFCNLKNYLRFFELFKDDSIPHIRIVACRIAKEYDRPDLLQRFVQDKDGHIRKLALS